MSCSCLKSHPDKPLVVHLKNVSILSENLVKSKNIGNKQVMADVARLIGLTHDLGKATTYFQDLLTKGRKSRNAQHGLLSSLLSYQVVKSYLSTTGQLGKFQSLPTIAWVVVKKHHGNIQNLWGEEYAEATTLTDLGTKALISKQIRDIIANTLQGIQQIFAEILGSMNVIEFFEEIKKWDPLTREIRAEVRNMRKTKNMDNYLTILFLYSVLLDADKMDASNMETPMRITEIQCDLVDRFKEKSFKSNPDAIGVLREQAYVETMHSLAGIDLRKDRLLSINLPTGIGKTLTGLSFSLKLRRQVAEEMGFVPRIIYCLPFLSIIDQNSSVLDKVLQQQFANMPSNLFLKHHHLSDVKYVELKDAELNPVEDLNKALLLMEAWDSEIIITTFVQFFHSLITNRNRAARKFHNMTNSIIILDEVQAIPSKYWLLINNTLKLLVSKFDCWVVLMTATQPLIFEPNQMKELIPNKMEYFRIFDRVEFQLDLDEKGEFVPRELDDFKETLLQEIMTNNTKDIMVVVNTIGTCQRLYNFLKDQLLAYNQISGNDCIDADGICNVGKTELINLSTYVLPSDRLRRINRIKTDDRRKVIVTTQLVEAGVDISVDVVYRDLAPLDSIIQTAGRCNRNGKKEKGIFRVVLLKKDENSKPFHYFVYDQVLVGATCEVLKKLGRSFSEIDIAQVIGEYYKVIEERSRVEDSEEIMDHLKLLDFADIAKFELIEEGNDAISIFIENGEEASRVKEEVQRIFQENKGFDRKALLVEMRKAINENTITIRYASRLESLRSLPIFLGEDFRYVPKEQVANWYKKDVGFIIPEDDVSLRII
jgi:CRISPR-associated endonuclease/helicase Cas3